MHSICSTFAWIGFRGWTSCSSTAWVSGSGKILPEHLVVPCSGWKFCWTFLNMESKWSATSPRLRPSVEKPSKNLGLGSFKPMPFRWNVSHPSAGAVSVLKSGPTPLVSSSCSLFVSFQPFSLSEPCDSLIPSSLFRPPFFLFLLCCHPIDSCSFLFHFSAFLCLFDLLSSLLLGDSPMAWLSRRTLSALLDGPLTPPRFPPLKTCSLCPLEPVLVSALRQNGILWKSVPRISFSGSAHLRLLRSCPAAAGLGPGPRFASPWTGVRSSSLTAPGASTWWTAGGSPLLLHPTSGPSASSTTPSSALLSPTWAPLGNSSRWSWPGPLPRKDLLGLLDPPCFPRLTRSSNCSLNPWLTSFSWPTFEPSSWCASALKGPGPSLLNRRLRWALSLLSPLACSFSSSLFSSLSSSFSCLPCLLRRLMVPLSRARFLLPSWPSLSTLLARPRAPSPLPGCPSILLSWLPAPIGPSPYGLLLLGSSWHSLGRTHANPEDA